MSVNPGFHGLQGFVYPWIGIPSTGQVANTVVYGALNALTGTGSGSGTVPDPADVRLGTDVGVTTGTLAVPATNRVLTGTSVDATTGTLTLPTAPQCLTTATFGIGGSSITGTVTLPAAASVLTTATFGAGNSTSGTYVVVTTANVRTGTTFGAASALTGTLAVPSAGNVLSGVSVDAGTGTYVVVTTANVRSSTTFGAASAQTGTLSVPSAANVLSGVSVDATTGTYVVVTTSNVKTGTAFGAASAQTGTYDGSDRWTDPGVSHVELGVVYKANNTSSNRTGTLDPGSGGGSDCGPPGATGVDQDYGGTDELAYKTHGGAGIVGATIQAYLTSDYDAGNRNSTFIVGRTTTVIGGAWAEPIFLDPGSYTLVFYRAGQYGPDIREITVT